ncbi:MAG: hypothetical protein ACYTCU_01330 [Planctomycetota bacterium]|jgi:hypothetical protein
MPNLLRNPVLTRLRRYVANGEGVVVLAAVLFTEMLGPHSRSDVDDIPWVLLLPLLFMTGCSVVRYRELPLTAAVLELIVRGVTALRTRLVLSLGLDFHPDRHPRLPAFTALRRGIVAVAAAAIVLYPARGLLREMLGTMRVPGFYTLHVLLLGAIWMLLLAGIAMHLPAIVLGAIEVLKGRTPLRGAARIFVVAFALGLVGLLLVSLDSSVCVQGCIAALAFASLLPTVVRAVDPPGGPWLNIAFGREGTPQTAPLGELIRDCHRLLALEALAVVCVLAPSTAAGAAALGDTYPVTNLLLKIYGWSAAWLYTGGALFAIGEFNRRRRLFDPAFARSRVLWAVPGPEARSLQDERRAIEAAGWRLVVSDKLPTADDADLLAGIPPGLMPPCPVPLARIPAALFLVGDRPAEVLCEADERDKARRALTSIERLLTATRPRFGDRGEGTFLVPQCWMVVGLTRDDDRAEGERPPAMTFGQSFQSALGTRLRRFLFEVMDRSGVDVFYIEDSVTPQQVRAVLEVLIERYIRRVDPAPVSEQDFMAVQGVHIVLHDVDPETEGIEGVDSHLTRNAISRARILIISRDRRDDDDDDDPPSADESSDSWLAEALRRLFPRLQPI